MAEIFISYARADDESFVEQGAFPAADWCMNERTQMNLSDCKRYRYES